MKKRRRRSVSFFTPEERAAQRARQTALEERLRLLEAELEASGSAFARMERSQRLTYALARAEAERAERRTPE